MPLTMTQNRQKAIMTQNNPGILDALLLPFGISGTSPRQIIGRQRCSCFLPPRCETFMLRTEKKGAIPIFLFPVEIIMTYLQHIVKCSMCAACPLFSLNLLSTYVYGTFAQICACFLQCTYIYGQNPKLPGYKLNYTT